MAVLLLVEKLVDENRYFELNMEAGKCGMRTK